MISDFTDTSTQLVVETPSGLPENIRHTLNVLSSLGVKDDAMFLALVNDCINADPLHLCRMVQKGFLNDHPDIHADRIVFSGTELHIPFGEGELPPREVVISLRDNATLATYFDHEADQYVYIADKPIFDFQILSHLNLGADTEGPDRAQALAGLINGLQEVAQLCYINQSALEIDSSLYGYLAAHIDANKDGC